MKRQGSSTSGQPPVKKSDACADLRSKIGAKLQTLLNGIDTDALLSAERRKQFYQDLFGKPKYSEIVFDPTIVIKIEPDDDESNSDSSTLHNSQNFLSSTKNRLSELLNKQDGTNKYKDSGKENTFCNNNKLASTKSSSFQNPSCSKSPSRSHNPLNKKRNSTSKPHTNTSSDSMNHDSPVKNLVVVLEDCMKSPCRKELSPTKHPVHNTSSNLEPKCVSKLASLNNLKNKGTNCTADLCSDESSKSYINSEISLSECSYIEENSNSYSSTFLSPESILSDDPNPSEVMERIDAYSEAEEFLNHASFYSEDESEIIDNPLIPQVIVKIGEADENNSDTEVELLCVKKPTTEVITLEDNDDDDDVESSEVSGHRKSNDASATAAGFIHECKQCGKSFRAESLLNFHIRMHGNNLSGSSSSSSHSFS